MKETINLLELIEEWDAHIEFSEDAYYDYYQDARKYKNMYENIKILYECKWCVDRPFPAGITAAIEKWLMNFDLKHERKIAFELVPKIIFYSKKEMEALCNITFKNLLKSVECYLDRPIDNSILNSYFVFVPLTDSGTVWCRFLRHSHRLNNQIVKQSINDLKNSNFLEGKHIIFVEDFTGSGSNVVKKYQSFKLAEKKKEISDIHFYYFTLIATEWGVTTIEKNTAFEVVAGEVLSSKHECFSDDSLIYPEPNERAKAEKVFQKYGLQLCNCDPEIKGFPLGFNNDHLTVVLYDNTPDNSLPVIWYPDKDWFPLFKRSPRYRRYQSGTCSI